MSLWALRLSVIGTLAIIIGASTLFLAVILSFIGITSIFAMMGMVIFFNLIQWLFAPYLIGAMYGVRELDEKENPRLHQTLRNLCEKSRMKVPRLMFANIPIPNAFAFGSPISGPRVAVTKGLLDTLEEEEVEAVIGHELGHLKHRDVQIMMLASVLPAIFYYIGYSLMISSWYGGGGSRRNTGQLILVGILAMAIYWILNLFVLGLSRLREYYADRFSVKIVADGARKLSEGLAKIVVGTGRIRAKHGEIHRVAAFKALFISDPDRATEDLSSLSGRYSGADSKLVTDVLSKPVTGFDRFVEIFSTHPNIVKRLKALQTL